MEAIRGVVGRHARGRQRAPSSAVSLREVCGGYQDNSAERVQGGHTSACPQQGTAWYIPLLPTEQLTCFNRMARGEEHDPNLSSFSAIKAGLMSADNSLHPTGV